MVFCLLSGIILLVVGFKKAMSKQVRNVVMVLFVLFSVLSMILGISTFSLFIDFVEKTNKSDDSGSHSVSLEYTYGPSVISLILSFVREIILLVYTLVQVRRM